MLIRFPFTFRFSGFNVTEHLFLYVELSQEIVKHPPNPIRIQESNKKKSTFIQETVRQPPKKILTHNTTDLSHSIRNEAIHPAILCHGTAGMASSPSLYHKIHQNERDTSEVFLSDGSSFQDLSSSLQKKTQSHQLHFPLT